MTIILQGILQTHQRYITQRSFFLSKYNDNSTYQLYFSFHSQIVWLQFINYLFELHHLIKLQRNTLALASIELLFFAKTLGNCHLDVSILWYHISSLLSLSFSQTFHRLFSNVLKYLVLHKK